MEDSSDISEPEAVPTAPLQSTSQPKRTKLTVPGVRTRPPNAVQTRPKSPSANEGATFTCSICKQPFATVAELTAHTTDHFRVIECTVCQKSLTGDTLYEYHMQNVHSIDVRKPQPTGGSGGGVHSRHCPHCTDVQFATDAAYTEHMHFAHPDRCRWYKCSSCKQRFVSKPELNVHLYAKHPEACAQLMACDICGRVCKDEAATALHRLTHTGGQHKDFLCTNCGQGFSRKSNLIFHMRTHSGEQPFECADCGKRFKLSGGLTAHRRTHTKERPYQCPFCEKSYKHSTDLRRHRRTHGGEEMRFGCDRCGKRFYERKFMVAHMRSCQLARTRLLQIEQVEVVQTVEKSPERNGEDTVEVFEAEHTEHLEEDDETDLMVELDDMEVEEASVQMVSIEELMLETGFECSSNTTINDCENDSSDDDTSALATSVDSKTETEMPKTAKNSTNNMKTKSIHECEISSEDDTPNATPQLISDDSMDNTLTSDASSLPPALPPSTDNQTLKCSICKRLFVQLDELNAHTAGHFKVVKCTLCNKLVTGDTKYDFHMRTVHSLNVRQPRQTSSADKRRCQYCPDSKFASEAMLTEHIHFAHPDLCHWYQCYDCGERFTSQPALNVHLFAEHPETCASLEACDFCGRVCVDATALEQHRQTHIGGLPKNFLCAHCGRGFVRKKQLESHVRTHTGEMPFQCDECGKRFRSSSNLVVHRRSHTKEKPFQCPFCQRSYAHTTDLRRHRRSHVAEEKRFACDRCGLKFYENKLLVAHVFKGCSEIRLRRQQQEKDAIMGEINGNDDGSVNKNES